jgi:predicted CoA-binding protein
MQGMDDHVMGVGRSPLAGLIYRRFRDRGYQVFPVNPARTEVEGDPCFPGVASIPDSVAAVLVATAPEAARRVVLCWGLRLAGRLPK